MASFIMHEKWLRPCVRVLVVNKQYGWKVRGILCDGLLWLQNPGNGDWGVMRETQQWLNANWVFPLAGNEW